MQLVAIDIGGTHARFAIATLGTDGSIELGEAATLATREYTSFQTAWEAFAALCGTSLPRAAALAIAAPVGQMDDDARIIRFTNNPWSIQPGQLPRQLGVDAVSLINDFEAVGHAVAHAGAEHFLHLAGPEVPLPTCGTLSIVGPGTGLGVAHVWRDGKGGYHVQATEGGHQDFAPLDAIDDALLARLRLRYPRVSTERAVSGPGIVDIYATLAGLAGHTIPPADDKTLWQSALSGEGLSDEDRLARAAAERFCLSLGAVAGDIALAQGASGVVIAGGLGLRIRDMLLASGFASRFCAKGRFSAMMATLPVKLITHPEPGLLGAAAAFAREYSL